MAVGSEVFVFGSHINILDVNMLTADMLWQLRVTDGHVCTIRHNDKT